MRSRFPLLAISCLLACGTFGCTKPAATGQGPVTASSEHSGHKARVPGDAPRAGGLSPAGKKPCAPFSCPAGTSTKVQENADNDAQYWRCDGESAEPIPILGCVKGEIVEYGVTLEGKKEGDWIIPQRGRGRSEATLKEGLFDGPYKSYGQGGELLTEATFVRGKIQWRRQFHKNGKVKEYGKYIDAKMHGEWKAWHPDGAQQSVKHYDHGLPTGRSLFYTPSGEVTYDESFLAGKLHGAKRRYKGKILILDEQWAKGKRDGRAVQRDATTGHKLTEGSYQAGQKTGEWLTYRLGKLSQSEEFIQGWLAKRCIVAGKKRCTEFLRIRSTPGCRIALADGKHEIARSDAELSKAIECPEDKRPIVDWKTEQVIVANFSRGSNEGHHWIYFKEGKRAIAQLETGYACQGARVVMRREPRITIVKTMGLPLLYRLKPDPPRRCGNVP